MLKKLYRREIQSLFPFLPIIWVVLPVVGLLLGLGTFVLPLADASSELFAFVILGYFSLFAGCMFLMMGAFTVTLVLLTIRFYRQMVSKEAYLTYSLPFTTQQHFLCKTVVSVGAMFMTSLSLLLSLLIFFGSIMIIFDLDINAIFGALPYTAPQVILTCILFLLTVLAGSANSVLTIFFSISWGHLFKKRILAAVLIYLGIDMVLSSLSSFVSMFSTIAYESSFSSLEFTVTNDLLFMNISFVLSLAFSSALSVFYFFMSRRLLTRKLNLE